ncbi:hypothetical protein IQ272_16010 [Chroococcidiopsidales cyanobacterium LEGE 13417]|nr:hypothetical protein [Chroococcidiopsidales cyanobacterium LEGE 13417]
MTIATAIATEQHFLSHDSTDNLTESSFEVLDDTNFELENILAHEFEQGLSSDILAGL